MTKRISIKMSLVTKVKENKFDFLFSLPSLPPSVYPSPPFPPPQRSTPRGAVREREKEERGKDTHQERERVRKRERGRGKKKEIEYRV